MSNSRVRRGFSLASGSGMMRSHTTAEAPIPSLMTQQSVSGIGMMRSHTTAEPPIPSLMTQPSVDSTRPPPNTNVGRRQQNLLTQSNSGVVRHHGNRSRGIGSRTEVRTINSNDQRRYSTGNNDINNNQR
ncbi:unnamed protein product, partial [Rotaria magnacalcarata]